MLNLGQRTLDCLHQGVVHASKLLALVRRCMSHQSSLIRTVVTSGMQFSRALSPVGRNVLFCVRWFRLCLCDFMTGQLLTLDT